MPNKKKSKNSAMRRANGTGGIINLGKRRRNPWMALVSHMVGNHQEKTIIGYFPTKTEAETALALAKITPICDKAHYTLKQLYDEWSEVKYKTIGKSTADNYRAGWIYLKEIENVKFCTIRADVYQSIIDAAAATKSRSTLEKIKTLSIMLSDYAMQYDIINKNYGKFIILPKAERSSKKSFNEEELKIIEDSAKNKIPFADCVLILCYTGFRINEFLGFKPGDYDAENRLFKGGNKNRAGKDKVLPVHPKIQPYVDEWLSKGYKYVFSDPKGVKYNSDYFRTECFKPCLEELKVRPLNPHECRHTFASLCHAAGMSKKTIMELMGHDDDTVDEKTYIHVDIKQLKEAISLIK